MGVVVLFVPAVVVFVGNEVLLLLVELLLFGVVSVGGAGGNGWFYKYVLSKEKGGKINLPFLESKYKCLKFYSNSIQKSL